jgi:hypothetical protein
LQVDAVFGVFALVLGRRSSKSSPQLPSQRLNSAALKERGPFSATPPSEKNGIRISLTRWGIKAQLVEDSGRLSSNMPDAGTWQPSMSFGDGHSHDCRSNLLHRLHNPTLHTILTVLLLLDVLTVVLSIALEIEYWHSKYDDCTDMVKSCESFGVCFYDYFGNEAYHDAHIYAGTHLCRFP